MKERPILFSAPMVRALLDGRKTQTRRIVKGEPVFVLPFMHKTKALDGVDEPTGEFGLCLTYENVINKHILCPYGRPGDRLWVKETWGLNHSDYIRPNPIPKARPADLEDQHLVFFATECDAEICNDMPRTPSIFMPRWASRITLEVTGVRVERLHNISEADALAEGAYKAPKSGRVADNYAAMAIAGDWFATGRGWYKDLWGRINGPESWDANPWVWVVEFKQVEP